MAMQQTEAPLSSERHGEGHQKLAMLEHVSPLPGAVLGNLWFFRPTLTGSA